jgi:hypothetical protein
MVESTTSTSWMKWHQLLSPGIFASADKNYKFIRNLLLAQRLFISKVLVHAWYVLPASGQSIDVYYHPRDCQHDGCRIATTIYQSRSTGGDGCCRTCDVWLIVQPLGRNSQYESNFGVPSRFYFVSLDRTFLGATVTTIPWVNIVIAWVNIVISWVQIHHSSGYK